MRASTLHALSAARSNETKNKRSLDNIMHDDAPTRICIDCKGSVELDKLAYCNRCQTNSLHNCDPTYLCHDCFLVTSDKWGFSCWHCEEWICYRCENPSPENICNLKHCSQHDKDAIVCCKTCEYLYKCHCCKAFWCPVSSSISPKGMADTLEKCTLCQKNTCEDCLSTKKYSEEIRFCANCFKIALQLKKITTNIWNK